MNASTELHTRAMQAAEMAEVARMNGDEFAASTLFREAFELERSAAEEVSSHVDYEPTRSVLLRSAASLALDCSEWREAERLVAIALAGQPPEAIAEELRDLSEQIYFQRHLDVRGVVLVPGEFQMALAGKAVGFGIAPSDEVVDRVAYAERMLIRIAERQAHRPFREGGNAPKDVREAVELFMSIPRAASYAVTFRVGRPKEQMDLPELIGTTDLVNELFECLSLYENGDTDALRAKIPDEAYFNNFTALAKQIAPDGEDIAIVGFTAEQSGRRQTVALKPRSTKVSEVKPHATTRESRVAKVTGRLLFADERFGANIIRLIDQDELEHRIAVPAGMMTDIVKPLWHDLVTVSGPRKRNTIYMEEITKADEPGISAPDID